MTARFAPTLPQGRTPAVGNSAFVCAGKANPLSGGRLRATSLPNPVAAALQGTATNASEAPKPMSALPYWAKRLRCVLETEALGSVQVGAIHA